MGRGEGPRASPEPPSFTQLCRAQPSSPQPHGPFWALVPLLPAPWPPAPSAGWRQRLTWGLGVEVRMEVEGPIILIEIKEKGKDTAWASGQTGKTALKTRWSDPSSLGLPSPAQGGVCSSECEQLSQKARPRDRGPRAQDPQLPTPRQCFPGQEQLSPQLQPPKRAPHCPRVQCHVPAFPALTSNTHWAPTPHGLLPGASVHSDGAG